jgi:hypothetical protein
VLRSIDGGTNRVHQRLNHGRAMTLCCTANRPRSAASIATASATADSGPSSTPLGTTAFARNPTV